jgi:subtilisin-like proprotein convertase family protein
LLFASNLWAAAENSALTSFNLTCSGSGGTNCPSAAFDDSFVTSQLNVPSGYCPFGIESVEVFTDISNPFISDLELAILSPQDTEVLLLADECGTFDDIAATFSDEGGPVSCSATSPAIANKVQPLGSLSVYKGTSPTGTWTLGVLDDDGLDFTTINDWGLVVSCNIPRVSISKISDGAEPNTNGQFKITLTSNDGLDTPVTGTAPVTGNLLYTNNATKGTDYTAPDTFTIPSGSSSITLDIGVIDDTEVEDSEYININIPQSSLSIGQRFGLDANITITDDDKYKFSIAKTTDAAEPNTNGQFTITMTPKNALGVPMEGMITYSGTATNGTDYKDASTSFSIPDGESTAVLNFTVLDDTVIESTETVIATISSLKDPLGAIETATATANIADNDELDYKLSIAKTTDGQEPNSNGQFTVTVSPANNSGNAINGTLIYTGTATKDVDYRAPLSFSIPDGASSTTVPFEVLDDNTVEGTETVTAELSLVVATSARASSRAVSIDSSAATATANINDNDTATNYTLSIAKAADGAEPSTNGQFTVTVAPANSTGAAITGTVAYSGTATNGSDYSDAPTSFSIADGASSVNLDFKTIDDTAIEGNETVIATISASSTGTLGTASATANLADNDSEASYSVSISRTTDGAEPSTNGSFTVTLTPANTTGTAINGSVAYSGTATNGSDYSDAPTSFSIADGASSVNLDFKTIDDTAIEGNETVIATISASSTGTLGTASATANLADNDSEANYSVSISRTTDGAEPSTNGQFTVTVAPANNTGAAITGTVAYSGTATNGSDYHQAPSNFSLPVGASSVVLPFTVLDDNEVEGTETVIATISVTPTAASSRSASDSATAEAVTVSSNIASANIEDNDTSTAIPIFGPLGLIALLISLFWLGRRAKL